MSGSASSKSKYKISEGEACGECKVRDKVEVHGQHEVCGGQAERQREIAIYRILPGKAECRFS